MLSQVSRAAVLLTVACLGAGFVGAARGESGTIEELQQTFLTPPDAARPMVRWWWFGPAVTKEGIDRELASMKAGGFGGVELQTTYPLAMDGDDVKNLKFLSPEYLELIGYAAGKCKELGLRMDLTLGSGWPYGGPMFSASEGAGRIETTVVAAKGGEAAVPKLKEGYQVIAAFAGPAMAAGTGGGRGGRGAASVDLSAFKQVPVEGGSAKVAASASGEGSVVFFIAGRTGMQVKRPANGAEGNVIDHLSGSVVDKFIAEVAEKQIAACGANPPYAVFCDSLEVQGENWTDDFLSEFQKRRGYDLTPLLPALMGNIGEQTEQVRYDYGRTVTELYNEEFNAKFMALAHKHGTKFRVQGYGSPAAGLESYAYSDLPEGEAGGNGLWRNFRTTRYAASASHLMGNPVTSSETFTWLHTAPFRATPVDIKGEVDTHFLDGINQTIWHGWAYTGNGAAYPGWSFYAAAVFDEKNPWYIGMPDVTGYITRMSALLREGTPANDVALYLPNADVWAKADTRWSSLNAAHTEDAPLLKEILETGFNADGWDDGMLALKGKVEGGELVFTNTKYGIVVLPAVTHMPLETARKLEEFAKGGGVVIAMKVPTKVPGMKATAPDQKELGEIMGRIFSDKGLVIDGSQQAGHFVNLKDALKQVKKPDVAFEPASPLIGAVHRHTEAGDYYFVANTANEPASVKATFRQTGRPEIWNPLTGKMNGAGRGGPVQLKLPAYGSTVVMFANRMTPLPPEEHTIVRAVDLNGGWKVTLADGPGGKGGEVPMEKLGSWTEAAGMKNYSGVGTYTKTFTVTQEQATARMVIAFGEAKAAAAGGGKAGNGFAAQIESPVRDVAVVYVNDKRVGAAWCPPYTVDVSGALKAGENTIKIEVGNTAVNYLAKAGFPNYDLAAVRKEYGRRFDPQGTELYAEPLPSGLVGTVELRGE